MKFSVSTIWLFTPSFSLSHLLFSHPFLCPTILLFLNPLSYPLYLPDLPSRGLFDLRPFDLCALRSLYSTPSPKRCCCRPSSLSFEEVFAARRNIRPLLLYDLCIVGQPVHVVSVQVHYLKLFITDFLEFLKTTKA